VPSPVDRKKLERLLRSAREQAEELDNVTTAAAAAEAAEVAAAAAAFSGDQDRRQLISDILDKAERMAEEARKAAALPEDFKARKEPSMEFILLLLIY